ncbi:MAG: PEP-CTERM sorting domain-containing protein, partial [Planctomycetota bacterium]
DSLNPGGKAQALIYQGDNATVLQIPPLAAGPFSDSEFIIAFEDLDRSITSNSDDDFDDAVVLVESISIVPEPATVAMTGLILGAALGFRARRRKRARG